jgi:hypothetical protein
MRKLIAVLLLAYFPLSLMAVIPSTTVWEVRQAGSDNNGGGYDSVTSGGTGTDFPSKTALNLR